MTHTRILTWLTLALLIAAGTYVRADGLSSYHLIGDELARMEVAHEGIWRMAAENYIDDNPVTFRIYFHAIHTLYTHPSLIFLRLPILIPSLALIVLFYLLGLRVTGSHALGLVAAAFITFSPSAIGLAQVYRPYTLMLFFVTLMLLALLQFERTGRRRYLFYYAAFFLGGVMMHPGTVIPAGCLGLVWLYRIICGHSALSRHYTARMAAFWWSIVHVAGLVFFLLHLLANIYGYDRSLGDWRHERSPKNTTNITRELLSFLNDFGILARTLHSHMDVLPVRLGKSPSEAMPWFWVIFLLHGQWWLWKNRRTPEYAGLFWLLPLLYAVTLTLSTISLYRIGPQPRYTLYALPFLLLPVLFSLADLFRRLSLKRRYLAAGALSAIYLTNLVTGGYFTPDILRARYAFDPTRITRQNFERMQQYLMQHAPHDRLVLSRADYDRLRFDQVVMQSPVSTAFYKTFRGRMTQCQHYTLSHAPALLHCLETLPDSKERYWLVFLANLHVKPLLKQVDDTYGKQEYQIVKIEGQSVVGLFIPAHR